MKGSGWKSFVLIFLYAPLATAVFWIRPFLRQGKRTLPSSGQAGWKFPNWEGKKRGPSKSAIQGSAIHVF
jgi:hypothetical protein